MAEFIGDVIVRIVTIGRVIVTIAVSIVERSQIIGNAFRVVGGTDGRPVSDDGGDFFSITGLEIGKELIHLSAGNLKDFIPLSTSFRCDGGLTVNSQRAGVVVVTNLTETQSGTLQLVVDVNTSDPKGASEQ